MVDALKVLVPRVVVRRPPKIMGLITSSSGTWWRSLTMSLVSMLHSLPLLKPRYALVVGCAQMTEALVANPAKLFCSISLSPCPPPLSAMSMKTPQNTPKPVSRLRLLLRVMVSSISLYVSKSNRILVL